jgi:hypothetical protein
MKKIETTEEFLDSMRAICNDANVKTMIPIIEEFVKDNIWDEERYSKEYDCGLKTGREQRTTEIVNYIFEQAGQAYIVDKMDEAKELKHLAKEIREKFTTK